MRNSFYFWILCSIIGWCWLVNNQNGTLCIIRYQQVDLIWDIILLIAWPKFHVFLLEIAKYICDMFALTTFFLHPRLDLRTDKRKHHSFMAPTRKISQMFGAPLPTNSTPSSSNACSAPFKKFQFIRPSVLRSSQIPPNFNLVFDRTLYCLGWQNYRTRTLTPCPPPIALPPKALSASKT